MIPLRLVIDTNIVVPAAIKPDGLQRTVLLPATAKPATLWVTEAILDEYREVLSRREVNIRKGLQNRLLQLVRSRARKVKPSHLPQVAKDPDDNKFLECRCGAGRLPRDRECPALPEVLEEDQGHHVAGVPRRRGTPPDSVGAWRQDAIASAIRTVECSRAFRAETFSTHRVRVPQKNEHFAGSA